MKRYLLTFFSLPFYSFLISQTVLISNQNTIGGDQLDNVTSNVVNTDGSVLLLGESLSGISGDKTTATFGMSDIWLVKLNSDLSISWQASYGGSDNDSEGKIISLQDGNFLIACSSESAVSGNKTVGTNGGHDFWLIKIDNNGTILWQQTYGGTGEERLVSICEGTDGSIYMVGRSDSGVSGDKTEASYGLTDYWLVKTTDTGDIIWDKAYGGSQSEEPGGMVIDENGDLIISGHSNSNTSGTKTEDSYGSEDYWLVKADSSGTPIWDRCYGGDDFDADCNVLTSQNSYYISGVSLSGVSGLKTEPNYGITDIWILKLDYSGSLIWQKSIGGNLSESVGMPTFTGDGQVLIPGSSFSDISGTKTEPNVGDLDYWLTSLDTSGTVLWDKNIGGTLWESCSGIFERNDNEYILFGSSSSNISGDKDENSNGSNDFWVVTLSSDLGYLGVSPPTVLIYPNPSSGHFSFSQDVDNVAVYDTQGRMVHLETEKAISLNLTNLSPGIYTVQFLFKGKVFSDRLIIK
ncbi:MAG: T9SS type A sorting domain-containing protein [Crocinitomicaceae bacterium]